MIQFSLLVSKFQHVRMYVTWITILRGHQAMARNIRLIIVTEYHRSVQRETKIREDLSYK